MSDKAAYTKLYQHPEPLIDLEFRNAYRRLMQISERGIKGPRGAAGANGSPGSPGADGAPGTGAVQCLKIYIDQNTLDNPGLISLGTLPNPHCIVGLFGYVWDWEVDPINSVFTLYSDPVSDPTPYIATTVVSGNHRVWPTAGIYVPIFWLGEAIEEERVVKLQIENNDTSGTGRLFVCLNYVAIP